MQKVRFLHGVLPSKDKPNLAPRLAMQCKGTVWNQVRMLDPSKLAQPDTGVDYLLDALSSWEKTSEMKTFELFEKALYKVNQRSDEAANSYSLKMRTAFADLGDKLSLKDVQAFVLLRQSALNNEDKKRVLTMTAGSMDLTRIEQAMRTLSTKVLLSAGEPKKKVYPANFVEQDETGVNMAEDEGNFQSTFNVSVDEEDILTAEHIEQLAGQGEEGALVIQQFEQDFEEMMQGIPDLQQALISCASMTGADLVDSGHRKEKGKALSRALERGLPRAAKKSC